MSPFKIYSFADILAKVGERTDEHEREYRRGYRDGFIAAVMAVYDLWFMGKHRAHNVLYDFWEKELMDWLKGKTGFVFPPRCVIKCVYCGKRKSEHLDHVFPKSRGGSSDEDNLVPACSYCNISKHARTPDEWRSNQPRT